MIVCEYDEEELLSRSGSISIFPCLIAQTRDALDEYANTLELPSSHALRELMVRDWLGAASLDDRRLLEYCPAKVPRLLKATAYTRLNPSARETLRLRLSALGVSLNVYAEGLVRRAVAEGDLAAFVRG